MSFKVAGRASAAHRRERMQSLRGEVLDSGVAVFCRIHARLIVNPRARVAADSKGRSSPDDSSCGLCSRRAVLRVSREGWLAELNARLGIG